MRRLAELRAEGKDPSASGAARGKVGVTNKAHSVRRAAWEDARGVMVDTNAFATDVLPNIQGISLTRLSKASGLSLSYCSKVRQGLVVPHPMHWEALAEP